MESSPQGQKRKWESKGNKQDNQRGNKRNKREDMGRQEYFRYNLDKRRRNDESKAKRDPDADDKNPFSKEEIEGEARQPKRKVAVMLGYAGSGYKGMQMMPGQKTIEGDIFAALVKAGAISKANADDPKKSSFVRCARTDKGVHAAGNVISLKLIIEDPDIVAKINENLPPQIRVWGIERTIAGFSCYQACDSRWYEYLIPTHCFLPPHPKSYMGQKLVELAKEADDLQGYESRQEEVNGFWEKTEEELIKPILETLDEETRAIVEEALYRTSTEEEAMEEDEVDDKALAEDGNGDDVNSGEDGLLKDKLTEDETQATEDGAIPLVVEGVDKVSFQPNAQQTNTETIPPPAIPNEETPELPEEVKSAIKALKAAYLTAKHQWRIPAARLARVQEAFAKYQGTHNFHNYTVKKSFNDASSKRHILSFEVAPTPIIINNTEWLSLKVHGQSFMMHQIRKMVGMAALVVRCGTKVGVLEGSFGEGLYSIPKVPGLGLLLERPVFAQYNSRAGEKFGRGDVGFGKWEGEIEEFKRREIYERIFGEEERDNVFHSFFTHVDNFRAPIFLYLSSKGLAACGEPRSLSNAKQDLSRSQRKGMINWKRWEDQGRKIDEAAAET